MSAPTPTAQLAFNISATCSMPTPIGKRDGGTAMMIPITGGQVEGPKCQGEVLASGADWALMKDDGTVHVKAHYAIKTHDGVIIQVINEGVNRLSRDAAIPTMLTSPRFIAPEGPYGWLNESVFVGTLLPGQPDPTGATMTVQIGIYQMV